MTRRLRLGAQVLALVGVAALLALLVWKLAHQEHAPPVGSIAPGFTLRRLDGGGTVSLASLRGHPVVLNFWASWCIPCGSEAGVLERDWQRYRSRGVVFVGVDAKDLSSEALRFVADHGLTFTILQDGSGSASGSYGVSQFPETYVLNRHGRIVAHLTGPVDTPAFAGAFRRALKEVAA